MSARLWAAVFVFLGFWAAGARAATQAQIDQAIEGGVQFLLRAQQQDGSWVYPGHNDGCTALAGLALLECGVKSKDPAIERAAEFVRSRASQCRQTYDIALMIFFLDRLGDKADQPLLVTLGERLRDGQAQSGAWTYMCQNFAIPGGDNSNTQFAVLGLWVARRHNVNVKEALARTDQYFRNSQLEDGGWQYTSLFGGGAVGGAGIGGAPSAGPMTCAGLLGLLVQLGSQTELKSGRLDDLKAGDKKGQAKVDPLKDPAVQRGLKCLEQHMTPQNGRSSLGLATQLYFLWSIERVGMAYGLQKIGAIDWYVAGADRIVAGQGQDGSWSDYSTNVGTSLALLFLKRANVAGDLTQMVTGKQEPGGTQLRSSTGVPEAGERPKTQTPPVKLDARNLGQKAPEELVRGLDGAEKGVQQLVLRELHDRKGTESTLALAVAVDRVDASLRDAAKELLSSRLLRMTAATLERYLEHEKPLLRAAAAEAAARKKEKSLTGPLVALLEDSDSEAANAAHAALVDLTGQDFGRFAGASKAERFVIIKRWKTWLEKNP
jgi:hypothetical protein